MKKLILIVLLVAVIQSLSAQNELVASKNIFVEFVGPGVVMSINYDQRFNSNSKTGLGYRIGFGYGIEKYENNLGEVLEDTDVEDQNLFYVKAVLLPFRVILRPFGDMFEGKTTPFLTVPIGLNYIIGNEQSASSFEFGGGVTLMTKKVPVYNYEYNKPGNIIGFITFMYRMAPVNSGFSFRVGITPIIGTSGDFYPTGAISLGYAF